LHSAEEALLYARKILKTRTREKKIIEKKIQTKNGNNLLSFGDQRPVLKKIELSRSSKFKLSPT
jgi:hypothetical protein